MRAKLAELLDAIPSLGRLPPEILSLLDLSELRVPRGRVAEARTALEREFGCHVVAYERSPSGSGDPDALHLCRIATAARLTPDHLDRLLAAETSLETERISFVAYERLSPR
ncbi:hypothetical protein FCE95_01935 [Luteimonas gilva]|uniref:Uncharacterized protein n=1 Tax=Luteimonas gilva TaxID=2572684 RepID=A0A4U5JWP8_9GAMM|nr:hypothetical protein [Luteimonas gilva]TKR33101.1 hypothetical protein FCE95_01935 [Luteimonas gilva]